jgi:predicted RNA-binding protein YlqC (UPF0109 family)
MADETETRDREAREACDLVRYMITSILGREVDVELETASEPGEFRIDVHVPSEYRGRIIGRHGRVARSMRNVLTAAQFDLPGDLTLDIVD